MIQCSKSLISLYFSDELEHLIKNTANWLETQCWLQNLLVSKSQELINNCIFLNVFAHYYDFLNILVMTTKKSQCPTLTNQYDILQNIIFIQIPT